MNIQHIEYFLQLAKYQHVSITADFLNISQPSLSKHIAALEKELGIKLFDHMGNRIVLNKNGEEFAKYARQAIDMLNAGIFSAKSKHYETTGQITIGCYSYSPIISRYAFEYSALNPLTTFQIIQCHAGQSSIPSDKLDFVLYSSADNEVADNKEQFWIPQTLFTENYVLIAAQDYPALKDWEGAADLSRLKEEPFVVMSQQSILFNDITASLCLNAGFFPRVYCSTDDFIVKIKAVASGLALAFIPEACMDDAKRLAPNLQFYLLDNQLAKRTIYIMRHKKQLMTECAIDFWDFILDSLK